VNLTNGAGIGQGAGTSVTLTGTASLQVQGAAGVLVTVTLNAGLGTNSIVVASSTTTFTGPVHLGGTLTLNTGPGARLSFLGLMDQIGAISKTGAGTLELNGNVNYSGNTQINGGTLLLNGTVSTSAIGVTNGTTLGGTGTTKVVTAVAGGTVAPGQSPGILTTGSVNLVAGSIYSVEINGATLGSGYDQLNVVGGISIGATLSVSLGYAPTPGTTFTIINNDAADAVTGTFAGLPEGSTFMVGGTTFVITYVGGTGNDVVLTAVVPPSVTIAPPASTTVCPADMVTLTAVPSGGTGMYTSYQWYVDAGTIGGANAVTYDATAAGTYTVTVTDSASATSPASGGVVLTDDAAAPSVTAPAGETVTQTLCM
jgi:fibronectin-binding autotransporter adhesin